MVAKISESGSCLTSYHSYAQKQTGKYQLFVKVNNAFGCKFVYNLFPAANHVAERVRRVNIFYQQRQPVTFVEVYPNPDKHFNARPEPLPGFSLKPRTKGYVCAGPYNSCSRRDVCSRSILLYKAAIKMAVGVLPSLADFRTHPIRARQLRANSVAYPASQFI